MKKLFVASALALAVTLASQGRASAWSEFKFSAGISVGWAGGGNSFLWGLFRSSPYPFCPGCPPPCQVTYFGDACNVYAITPIGGCASGYCPPTGLPYAQAAAPEAAPAPAQYSSYNPYYNSGYQPVGYTYPGYAQTPAYWYGR